MPAVAWSADWMLHPMEPRAASRISPTCMHRLEFGDISLFLQIHFFEGLSVATILLCAHMMQLPRASSAKDSFKDIAHCARKPYFNAVLGLFPI
jgi:hypothetical protein